MKQNNIFSQHFVLANWKNRINYCW